MSVVPDPSAAGNVNPDLPPGSPALPRLGLWEKFRPCPARLDVRRQWPVLFFVVAVILFFRQPAAVFHPSFYAEDGVIFFKQQYEQGFASALFTRYAGYLHFAPRIVAAVCALLPLECAPAAYAAASLLIAAAVLTFFFAPGFRAVIDSDSLRALIVLIFTLMPNAEPLMKLAYLNWYMLFFLALVTLFTLPQRPVARWLFLVPVAVAAWSNPVGMVCLPLILLRAWRAADRAERLWWALLALALLGFLLTAERPPSTVTTSWREKEWKWELLHAIGYRVFCFFFAGDKLASPSPGGGWTAVTVFSLLLAGFCAAGALAAAVPKARGMVRKVPLALYYLILGLPALLVLRPEWLRFFQKWDEYSWSLSGRYFFCSTLLLCVLGGVIYERALRNWVGADAHRRLLAALLLLGWLSLHLPGFRLWDWHARTPWREYAREIRAAEARARTTGGAETVQVRSLVVGFDFGLIINPAPAKSDRAPSPRK